MTYVPQGGQAIAGNSSTATLNAGATFTGTAANVLPYSDLIVTCYTDKAGTLYVDFSNDGTNWDSTLSYSVAASTNEVHRIRRTRAYARVRFTNTSASNQTVFRLSVLGDSQSGQITSTINSVVQADADALVVRPIEFNLLVAKNQYQDHTVNIKDCLKGDVDAGSGLTDDLSNELIAGAAYTGFPATAQAAEIVVAGADTGTVYYSYMATDTDTDYTFGTKAVTGAGTYALGHNIWRCNFAYFVKDSTTAFNAGNITVQSTAGPGTYIFCRIDAGYGQSYCGAYTVPYNATALIDRFNGNVRGSATGTLDGFFWYRPYGESPRLRFPFELQFGTLYFDDVDYLIRIPARTDFIPRVISSSANNLSCKFSYRLVRIKD